MKPVYSISSNLSTPLGLSTDAVWEAVMRGESGVGDCISGTRRIIAARLGSDQWETIGKAVPDERLSPFERLAVYSAEDAISRAGIELDPSRSLFILTTTKGNIEWLGEVPDARLRLSHSAALIAAALHLTTRPVTISHACVSGVTGLIQGLCALQSGRFDTAIVTGADRLTEFVVSGFQSFQALADERCRPFDAERKGINLGEGAATIILSTTPGSRPLAELCGGATSNDANHISGPSRTGEELALAIRKTLAACRLRGADIDVISAHGTATIYNDEMEAKAFAHAGVLHAPLHSLKGYFGHTLGAAGVLESAVLVESLRRKYSIRSLGFTSSGVSQPVRVSTESLPQDSVHALKTASGFGGCNAAVVWSRV